MSIRIQVDLANPGQFFACCGLLELADRLWGGAKGYFSPSADEFVVEFPKERNEHDAKQLRSELGSCAISSTMTDEQINHLKKLLNQEKTSLTPQHQAEKQRLSQLWEQERIYFAPPFDLWIDWWGDTHAGGNRLKTWAGKQFVIDLVRGMQSAITSDEWSSLPAANWLSHTSSDGSLPLYFDADIGGQSSSRDVGFSLDALHMRSGTRPMIELLAFVGLQRFRALRDKSAETFSYFLWTEPLPPMLAAVACSGYFPQPRLRGFEFRLLYRTKYLKSFLVADPKGV